MGNALNPSVYDSSSKPSLYDRLGGIYAISAVVNYFSDEILKNPMVGINSPNKQLREWSRGQPDRLPGLKFMRTGRRLSPQKSISD